MNCTSVHEAAPPHGNSRGAPAHAIPQKEAPYMGKYIMVAIDSLESSNRLRFFELDIDTLSAKDVTPVLASVPEVLRTLSAGGLWARGDRIYTSRSTSQSWRKSIKKMFGPITPEREALLRKAVEGKPDFLQNTLTTLLGKQIILQD